MTNAILNSPRSIGLPIKPVIEVQGREYSLDGVASLVRRTRPLRALGQV